MSPPRLLWLVREAARLRNLSPRTEKAYVFWIRRFVLYHGKRHPREMGAPQVRPFLSHLAVERKVAASTQNQALAALVFLYRHVLKTSLGELGHIERARKPARLPVVLTRDEVRSVLTALRGPPRLVAGLLYGSGLRLLEALRLRVKDLDFESRSIIIRRGKGAKDRISVLPDQLSSDLAAHLEHVAEVHRRDLAVGYGRVVLPSALERKYPGAARSWGWQFTFPAARPGWMRARARLADIICTNPWYRRRYMPP